MLVGAILSTVLPISAAVQQYILTPATYPIMVNGKELNDPDFPVLNYNGTTYLSLRKTAEAVGADLKWNEEERRVEIINKATDPEYKEKLEQAALESLIDLYGEDILDKRSADEFPVGARETLLKFKMVYYKSDVINISLGQSEHQLMKYNEEYYVPVNIISSYSSKDGWDYYITLPGKQSILVQTGEKRQATEHSFKDGGLYIKLSSLGLKPRIEGDICWLEWAE